MCSFNEQLRALARQYKHIIFWPHRNLSADWPNYIMHDGVHLNPEGLERYANSIRRAVVRARHTILQLDQPEKGQ